MDNSSCSFPVDALASIDARADDIKKSTVTAKELSDDVAKIKFAVEATKKSLDDLDSRRTKRDAENVDPEDMGRRLNILKNSASRFADMRANLTKIMKTVRTKLATVRKTVSRYLKLILKLIFLKALCQYLLVTWVE